MAEFADISETRPARWSRSINVIAVGFSLAVCGFGIISILGVDYSNAEIEESLVDTWEAAAASSYILLPVVAVVAVTSFAFATASTGIQRGKLLFTGWLAALAFVLQFIGMLILTRRAELLHDSDLTGLFYFF